MLLFWLGMVHFEAEGLIYKENIIASKKRLKFNRQLENEYLNMI